MEDLENVLNLGQAGGIFEIKDDVIYMNTNSKLAYTRSQFLRDLIQNLIDSYYIVLSTINEIMEKGCRI